MRYIPIACDISEIQITKATNPCVFSATTTSSFEVAKLKFEFLNYSITWGFVQ